MWKVGVVSAGGVQSVLTLRLDADESHWSNEASQRCSKQCRRSPQTPGQLASETIA